MSTNERDDALEALRAELGALRKRVGELEDRDAIRELTHRYMQAMHDARFEDAVDCFAEDAEYDHGLLGELRGKPDLRVFYTQFMPAFESAGGWSYDVLANPLIRIDGDRAEARWFLLTFLIDPDTQKPAWAMATLEYEYAREAEGWRFKKNRCIHEHILAPYDKGWGPEGGSKLPNAADALPIQHFEKIRAQGGKQRPGKTSRSIRGWTVPTLEPGDPAAGR
ncbi:MAG: nuclear transport factor 2 family protein [Myxococcota bacterium]